MFFSYLTPWTIVAWIVAMTWVGIVSIFYRGIRSQRFISADPPGNETFPLPSLSVLVAARNESKCIEKCIRSILRQDYPGLQVIAINDRSTDNTAEILDRLAIEFSDRLKVIHATSLPSGWFGKPHALTLGCQHATGELLLFTDADCDFEKPSALRAAVHEMSERRLDMFSITARYAMASLRESILVPCCSEMILTWIRPDRTSDPNWPDAFANGAFIMVQRKSFDQIGGWESVKNKISEDLQIARLAKQSNLRVGVGTGEGFYSTAAYETIRDSWNGWSRIFKGSMSVAQLGITVARMMILFVLPLLVVACGVAETIRTGSLQWVCDPASFAFTLAFCLRTMMDIVTFRLVRAPAYASLLAPFGRIFVMAACVRALFSHAGLVNTYWRGNTFSAGQLVMPRSGQAKPQIR